MNYHSKGLFGVFTLLAAWMTLRVYRFAGWGEGSSDKWPLAKGTGSEIECRFNGLTRQTSSGVLSSSSCGMFVHKAEETTSNH